MGDAAEQLDDTNFLQWRQSFTSHQLDGHLDGTLIDPHFITAPDLTTATPGDASEDLSHDPKRQKIDASSTSTAILPFYSPVPRLRKATEMKLPAELIKLMQDMRDRGELGYRRKPGPLKLITTEIDCSLLRKAMKSTFRSALLVRLCGQEGSTLSDAAIETEAEQISFATTEMAMTAIYAKLHNIFRGNATYSSRYTSAPSYTGDIELPLPIALAIQDLGAFETACLPQNYLAAPTYPEGTENEGREFDYYPLMEYSYSYLPTIKSLGIPVKAVDTTIKAGSPWWTFNVRNVCGTSDLVCTLPMSLYSDLSTELRSIFLARTSDEDSDSFNFMKMPEDSPKFGMRLREMPPGGNVRAFLALCHGPKEEWSLGTI